MMCGMCGVGLLGLLQFGGSGGTRVSRTMQTTLYSYAVSVFCKVFNWFDWFLPNFYQLIKSWAGLSYCAVWTVRCASKICVRGRFTQSKSCVITVKRMPRVPALCFTHTLRNICLRHCHWFKTVWIRQLINGGNQFLYRIFINLNDTKTANK